MGGQIRAIHFGAIDRKPSQEKHNYMPRLKALSLALSLFVGVAFLIGCNSSASDDSSTQNNGDKVCVEPENPYSYGTAEYKGYEWAEEHGRSCNASSTEFTEGCEEYDNQEAEYEECQARKH